MILKINTEKLLEKEIITKLVNGKSSKQIANQLGFSKSSICNKLQKIYFKYGVSDRHELVYTIYKNNISKLKDEIIRLQIENENLKSALV